MLQQALKSFALAAAFFLVTSSAAQTGTSTSASSVQAECRALDERVAKLDEMARQPHSAATQDWIRAQRRAARDRQVQLRC